LGTKSKRESPKREERNLIKQQCSIYKVWTKKDTKIKRNATPLAPQGRYLGGGKLKKKLSGIGTTTRSKNEKQKKRLLAKLLVCKKKGNESDFPCGSKTWKEERFQCKESEISSRTGGGSGYEVDTSLDAKIHQKGLCHRIFFRLNFLGVRRRERDTARDGM